MSSLESLSMSKHITIDTCINQFMFIVSYSTETTTMITTLTTVSTTVLVNNEGIIAGWIVGVTVLTLLLAVSIIIILILVVYIKRANNQKRYIY